MKRSTVTRTEKLHRLLGGQARQVVLFTDAEGRTFLDRKELTPDELKALHESGARILHLRPANPNDL